MNRSRFARHQKKTILAGILSVVIVLVVLQLWLLSATMNAYLGGDNSVLLPAALVSLVCLLLNAGLLRYLYGLDSADGAMSRGRRLPGASNSAGSARG